MGFLKLPIIILLTILILVLGLILFLKTQFNKQKTDESAFPIQIFRKTSPTPTSLKPYEQLSEEEKHYYQTIADDYYSKMQDAILKAYPWYNYFPIKGQDYFVYFDLDQKKFFGLLYPQKSSPVPIDDQISLLKEIITDRLRNVDVKTLDLPLEWEIKLE